MQELKKRILDLFKEKEIERVIAWKKGDLEYSREPSYFESAEELDELVYDGFSSANLSKFMIEASRLEGKTLCLLKPCDTYSFNQLLKEHRVDREKAYIIGIGCSGKIDPDKIKQMGIKGITKIDDDGEMLKITTLYGDKQLERKDVLLERCLSCKGKEHKIFDEIIGESTDTTVNDRFSEVKKIEEMSSEEKFNFFQSELSRCIRCNACRNVCPACSCEKCVFDGNQFDSSQKANSDSFEEKMFHIIRAFHVSGRCTDCGECSRVCPQKIPLHLFNRKFIKDINEFYGEFQAGENIEAKNPLTDFNVNDREPGGKGNV